MWRLFVASFLFVQQTPHVVAEPECKESYQFSRHLNKALLGHVMKTLAADYITCTETCTETLGCFSFNLYTDKNGKEMCELNNSTKTTSPKSFVEKWDYEYNEMEFLMVDGWYRFNSTFFKLFKNRLTWGGASAFCRSLGGNLTSISSEMENAFIKAFIIPDTPRGNSSDKLMASWRLDGTDPDVKLYGAAAFQTVDGHIALYLNGQTGNYATTPALDLTDKSFLIEAWIKVLTPMPTATGSTIYSDWSSPHRFIFGVKKGPSSNTLIRLRLRQTDQRDLFTIGYSPINFSEWVHVAASWDRLTRTGKIYVNGQQRETSVAQYNGSDINLQINNHTVYDIGLKRASGVTMNGYIKELAVFKLDTRYDIATRMAKRDKFDGVWIGLNDVKTEGTFINSDSSPVTFTNFTPGNLNNQRDKDCSSIKLSDIAKSWDVEPCGKELPFICKKTAE